jgi:hypothetical protein
MNLAIDPYIGVGILRFGMPRAQVRACIGEPFEEFKRNEFAVNFCDFFPDEVLWAHYTDEGNLNAIECGDPASPVLFGQPIIGFPTNQIASFLAQHDDSVNLEADALTSMKLGVSIYSPDWKNDPESRTEGLIAFARGYFDA